MILNELKNRKRIKDMDVNEQGFLHPGAIIRDEKGAEWLNLNAFVTKEYKVLAKIIIKISGDNSDYEIIATDFITANADTSFTGHSEILKDCPDLICLSDMIDEAEQEKITMDNQEELPVLPNKKILQPLYDIFLEPETLNTVLMRTSIPEIINRQPPIFNGVILYGEGGTGKTALQKALSTVFENAGCIAEELNVAQLSEKYIGSLANNLDARIGEVLFKSEKNKCPAFIFLDEASSLVMSQSKHNESGVDYYQEAVDVLKKYISNYPNLIISITTNMKPDTFDDTLIREGRLHPVHIAYPGEKQKMQMWKHFLKIFDVTKPLSDEQYKLLAEAIPKEQGAFINEFCKSYLPAKKLEMEASASGAESLLDVLASGQYISIEKVRSNINFDSILEDLITTVTRKHSKKKKHKPVGFLKRGIEVVQV